MPPPHVNKKWLKRRRRQAPSPSCARSSSTATMPENIVCNSCDGIYSREEWWEHIISKEHQQSLHRQNVKDPASVLHGYDSPVKWEPLDRNWSDSSPWRESDDDFATDDNNNLVPWSWRAKEAAILAAQTNTVSELEHKANLKLFRQDSKFEARRAAAKMAKEMEVDQDNTNDMETWHFDEEGRVIAKVSKASSSSKQPPDQPSPRTTGIPGFTLPPLTPSLRANWWDHPEEVRAKMWHDGINATMLSRLNFISRASKNKPICTAFTASYIINPLLSVHSEVYPHGGGVLLQKWFDIEKEEDRICLTDMAGKKDYYGISPFLPRDETIVKYRLLEMVEEMGLCIDEVTDIFQECSSLSTIVSDNELGISGWKSGFLYNDFTKKKVQEMLDYLHMQLFMKLPHLHHLLEHIFAP